MSNRTGDERPLDRRGFLKGSALFAAALAVTAAVPVPASAQDAPAPSPEKKDETPKTEEPPKHKPLLDKDGREYRVCDMCGGNMYKDGKIWTCEQCGYSYEE